MEIMKQIDLEDVGITNRTDLVAFVTAHDVMRGPVGGEYPLHRYTGEIHRRPVGQASAFRWCQHDHRSLDAATRCTRTLLRLVAFSTR